MTYYGYYSSNELYHFGIKGMKWGVRRFQDKDGSLTSAGRRRYGIGSYFSEVHTAKKNRRLRDREIQNKYDKALIDIEKRYKKGQNLSDKDLNREQDLDRRTQNEWARSKEQYKKDKRAARERYENEALGREKAKLDAKRKSVREKNEGRYANYIRNNKNGGLRIAGRALGRVIVTDLGVKVATGAVNAGIAVAGAHGAMSIENALAATTAVRAGAAIVGTILELKEAGKGVAEYMDYREYRNKANDNR